MKKISIGIDFSKKTFDATIIRRDGDSMNELSYSKFDNDIKGFKNFESWVKKTVRDYPEWKDRGSWIFCGENTGVCSAGLSDYLVERSYPMWLESAMQIHLKSGVVRHKDDKADSRRIAEYALINYSDKARLHEPDSSNYKRLHALYAAHDMLTRDKVSKTNQIKSGILDCCKEALELASKQLKDIVKQLECVDNMIKKLMSECDEFRHNYEILTSMKGVGVITACCLIIKTHNFKYMTDARVLGNYVGVVPSQKRQSGTSVNSAARVSNIRDKDAKTVISQSAMSAIRHNDVIRDYYTRLVKRGIHPNKARNNCKFKIINILLAMIRNDKKFDTRIYGKSKAQWRSAV